MRPLALVVENDSATRRLLDVVLSRLGCETDVVGNGLDALLLLDTIDYDLAVLDLITPGASGAEILEWLRTTRPAMLERTIVLSSATPTHLTRVRDAYPPVRTIRKPFDLAELIEAVSSIETVPERADLPAGDEFSRRSITAGAKAGLLVRCAGEHLQLVHNFGYRADQITKWFPMAHSAPFPLCTCVRDGKPQWLASLSAAAAQYPSLAPVWQQYQSLAVASVPLLRNGVVVGAAGWTFREPHLFDESEQQAFIDIAASAASALDAVESAAAGA